MRPIVILIIAIILLIIFVVGLFFLFPTLIPGIIPRPTPTPAPIPLPTFVPGPTGTVLTPTPTPVRLITPTPLPGGAPVITPPATTRENIYNGPGFSMPYPQGWSVLTCANSQNFEFDPAAGVDQRGVICDYAVKPITVLVQNSFAGCPAETAQLGNNTIRKSVVNTPGYTLYTWCTDTQPVLQVTHRVSANQFRGTSPTDHSSEIENMLSQTQYSTTYFGTPQAEPQSNIYY